MQTRNLGVAIITIGIIMIIYIGFNYITFETAIDPQSVKINDEKNQPIQFWLLIVGLVFIVGGSAIVFDHEKNAL